MWSLEFRDACLLFYPLFLSCLSVSWATSSFFGEAAFHEKLALETSGAISSATCTFPLAPSPPSIV